MNNRCKLITQRRKSLRLTQSELGKAVGLSQQQIGRIEKGSPLTLNNALKISEALGIDKALLLPDSFIPPHLIKSQEIISAQPLFPRKDLFDINTIHIDILDVTACCGNGFENISENVCGQWAIPVDDFRSISLSSNPGDIKMLRVRGDSMEPTLKDGDWVLTDISRKIPESDGMYLLQLSTGLAVKRLQGSSIANAIKIISDNPIYDTENAKLSEIVILGRIIYTLRTEKVG